MRRCRHADFKIKIIDWDMAFFVGERIPQGLLDSFISDTRYPQHYWAQREGGQEFFQFATHEITGTDFFRDEIVKLLSPAPTQVDAMDTEG